MSFDDSRVLDARRFIDNALDPYPLGDLPEKLQNTPQGKSFWIRKKAFQAKQSFARASLNHALAMRTPSADRRGWLERVWRESKAPEHRDALLKELPEQISYAELLKTEVDRRYASPSWYAGIAGSAPSAVLREIAYMQAFQLNLDYQRYRQSERIEMLLAAAQTGGWDATERGALQAELAAANALRQTEGEGGSGEGGATPMGGHPPANPPPSDPPPSDPPPSDPPPSNTPPAAPPLPSLSPLNSPPSSICTYNCYPNPHH